MTHVCSEEATTWATCTYNSADYLPQRDRNERCGHLPHHQSRYQESTRRWSNQQAAELCASRLTRTTTGGTPQDFYIADALGGPYLCQFSMPTQSCVVTGLTNGVEYQFVALTRNWVGESAVSAPSVATAPTGDAFLSTWDTENTSTGSSNSTSVTLPLVESGTYDFVVNWGDGAPGEVTSADDPDATHVFSERGVQRRNHWCD